MAVADADLIDGALLEFAVPRLLVTALQVAFLDILDDVPAYLEVPGHVLDGHESAQFEGVALESPCVTAAWSGEVERHLAGDVAGAALNAWDGQDHVDGLAADRDGFEGPLLGSVRQDVSAATAGTA